MVPESFVLTLVLFNVTLVYEPPVPFMWLTTRDGSCIQEADRLRSSIIDFADLGSVMKALHTDIKTTAFAYFKSCARFTSTLFGLY